MSFFLFCFTCLSLHIPHIHFLRFFFLFTHLKVSRAFFLPVSCIFFPPFLLQLRMRCFTFLPFCKFLWHVPIYTFSFLCPRGILFPPLVRGIKTLECSDFSFHSTNFFKGGSWSRHQNETTHTLDFVCFGNSSSGIDPLVSSHILHSYQKFWLISGHRLHYSVSSSWLHTTLKWLWTHILEPSDQPRVLDLNLRLSTWESHS